jgi:DNA invertase Pin-like site-specific DNA recombinase
MILTEALAMPQVAYSLIRYSDPQQRQGHSKERQEGFAERWCAANNARLDTDLSMLLDGQSAFRGKHRKRTGCGVKPLAQFLDDIKTGRVAPGSILIMERIDRLSREEIDEAYEFFRSILRAGVDVVTERPERRYTKKDLNNFAVVLEVKFAMYLAHEESAKKSERIGAAWAAKKLQAEKRKAPVSISCPAWIELVGLDGEPVKVLGPDGKPVNRGRVRLSDADRYKYRVVPDRAAVVRRMIDLTLDEELGADRIAHILNDEGTPCFGRGPNKKGRDGKDRDKKARWTPNYVRGILKSPALYGAYQRRGVDAEGNVRLQGEPIPEFYPPVIGYEKWLALQKVIKANFRACGRPGDGEANLFTGIITEAISRERCSVATFRIKAKGLVYKYLRPFQYDKRGGMIPYENLEHGIVRALSELKPEDVLAPGEEADAQLRRINDLSKEVEALAERVAYFEAKQQDPATDPDLLPSVEAGIIDCKRRHREKVKALRALEEEASTSRTKTLGACQSALSLLDTPERRRVGKARIRQLVESIWIVCQTINTKTKIVHVQIYLRGGRRVYWQVSPLRQLPEGTRVWQLGRCDFRAGDVGDAARRPRKAKLVG